MKKIAVVTTTRAEYGLLRPVILELRKFESDKLRVDLLVSGTHLSDQFGMTVDEIKKDGLRIDSEIPIALNTDSPLEISGNQADVLMKFTELFQQKQYNGVVLLGDRYEILAVAIAATNTQTPIFHISGGDVTEGAVDESIRHSITKMSFLHFPTNHESWKRVIQLGEDPGRVFNFGSTSIDNIKNLPLLTKKEAMESVNCQNDCFAVCTYHPVTLEKNNPEELMESFFMAIAAFPEIDFIVTKSNADQGGNVINELLDRKEKNLNNMFVFSSLGVRRYLSLVKYSQFVLGNSSSGIIEVPAFGVPTVNVGDRQKGRLRSESIIDCNPDSDSIINAIHYALDDDFRDKCRRVISPFGDGTASIRIAEKCIDVISKSVDLKKSFYDVEFSI